MHQSFFASSTHEGIARAPALALQFEDDVYVATSEPHGSIEATVTRGDVQPHCRL